jgi:hypothetical protein
MISLAYPLHSYACTEECKWTGLVPSLSGRERRKRQVRLVIAFVVLVLAAGLAVWKYGAGLTWSPVRSPTGDGVEEDSSGAAQ